MWMPEGGLASVSWRLLDIGNWIMGKKETLISNLKYPMSSEVRL
jgi:hypothetical protein